MSIEYKDYEGLKLTAPEIVLYKYLEEHLYAARRNDIKINNIVRTLIHESSKHHENEVAAINRLKPVLPSRDPIKIQPKRPQMAGGAIIGGAPVDILPTDARKQEKREEEEESDDEEHEPTFEDVEKALLLQGDGNDDNAAASSAGGYKIKKRIRADDNEDDDEETEDPTREIIYTFGEKGTLSTSLRTWDSEGQSRNKEYLLPGYHPTKGSNLILLQVTILSGSTSWAFNICPMEDEYCTDIRCHFNPRYPTKNKPKRFEIVTNHKRGTWGDDHKTKFKHLFMEEEGLRAHSKSITLKIRLSKNGLFIFADDIFVEYFPLRRSRRRRQGSSSSSGIEAEVEDDEEEEYDDAADREGEEDVDVEGSYLPENLKIIFPPKDANGSPYGITVHQVWWGKDLHPLATTLSQLSEVQRLYLQTITEEMYQQANMKLPMLPRTLIMEGLLITEDLEILQGLEYEILTPLEAIFGEKVIAISLVPNADFGYVRLPNVEGLQEAMNVINVMEIDDDETGRILKFTASLAKGRIGREKKMMMISVAGTEQQQAGGEMAQAEASSSSSASSSSNK